MFDVRRSFQVTVPAKWILAGEHSVLVGGLALALPYPHYSLTLRYVPDLEAEVRHPGLRIEESGTQGVSEAELRKTIFTLIRQLGAWSRVDLEDVFQSAGGSLQIESTIPIGGGLGSSAALCVALCRWFGCENRASELENYFHGKSSGMDTAVISSGCPVLYSLDGGVKPVDFKTLPRFTLHDTGLRAKTKDCIAQVNRRRASADGVAPVAPHAKAAIDATDRKMTESVTLALESLQRYDRGERAEDRLDALAQLAHSLKRAHSCYRDWDLLPESAQELEKDLYLQGALAVKMTGAGLGGMLVALWPEVC